MAFILCIAGVSLQIYASESSSSSCASTTSSSSSSSSPTLPAPISLPSPSPEAQPLNLLPNSGSQPSFFNVSPDSPRQPPPPTPHNFAIAGGEIPISGTINISNETAATLKELTNIKITAPNNFSINGKLEDLPPINVNPVTGTLNLSISSSTLVAIAGLIILVKSCWNALSTDEKKEESDKLKAKELLKEASVGQKNVSNESSISSFLSTYKNWIGGIAGFLMIFNGKILGLVGITV